MAINDANSITHSAFFAGNHACDAELSHALGATPALFIVYLPLYEWRNHMRWNHLVANRSKFAQMTLALVLSIAASPIITETLFGWRWN